MPSTVPSADTRLRLPMRKSPGSPTRMSMVTGVDALDPSSLFVSMLLLLLLLALALLALLALLLLLLVLLLTWHGLSRAFITAWHRGH